MRQTAETEGEYRGALDAVRSDGRGRRTLLEGDVVSADLSAGGVVHAAREEKRIGNNPPSSSLVTGHISRPMLKGEEEAGISYLGVAASSDGRVAIGRQTLMTRPIPAFLADGVDDLRSTSVPVLVPPEEPPGTGGVVPTAEQDSYQLLFTNDPAGELAHVEQVNVLVSGTTERLEPIPDAQSQRVSVRGTTGQFFCGASVCFLTWPELGATYTVGEFGSNEDAVAFADSLIPIESLAGPLWRQEKTNQTPTPELIVRDSKGHERSLDSVEGSCECGFRPLDWSPANDRVLVLASAEGDTSLQEYLGDGSDQPTTLAEGISDRHGRDVILDAAYGPDGVVALFGGEGGPPGTLQRLGGEVLATDVRAFDIEGTTLAYVNDRGAIIARDLETGNERTVGEGAIEVSLAPDVIRNAWVPATPPGNDGFPLLLVAMIALASLMLLGGTVVLARRRRTA